MAYGEKYEETPKQKEQFRLWSAIYQIENIRKLTENNEYKQFISTKPSIRLRRQRRCQRNPPDIEAEEC